MAGQELLRADPGPGPTLGESRSRVLAVLQGAGAPLSVGEVAERLGLHANTARFHLDGLIETGLVERTTEQREQPGRPRALYAARPDAAVAGRRSYRLLAEILTSYVAAETAHPRQAAVRAGQAWGRYLAEKNPPFRRIDAAAATAQLVGMLSDIGFTPEAVTAGRQRQILLHHCPFREAAEQHREVVCSIHLGLMQGLLAELHAPVEADRLDPFVEPSLCIAHLTRRADGHPARDPAAREPAPRGRGRPSGDGPEPAARDR
jgi:predicted ArsR family transcriptional regulator